MTAKITLPSADRSSSKVREGWEAPNDCCLDWGVGRGEAGLGADPTDPVLLGWPWGTLPLATAAAAQSSNPAAVSNDLWWTFIYNNNNNNIN